MIGRAYNDFADFMGATGLRALFVLIAGTGLLSLILNAVEAEWVALVQMLLFFVALVGSVVIIIRRLEREDRGRWIAILLPAFGALILALTVLPQFAAILIGGALGWIVAGFIIFRPRTPMQYQQAIRHLRKNQYEDAVKVMDGVIKEEPDNPNHYRFRAELLRLWGKLDRARRDYIRMTEIDPESAVAFNGLAEVNLQARRYDEALEAARKAADLAPDEWVALYNLGMIEDRLDRWQDVIAHVSQALDLKVPDARHRLLMHLYLARAYTHLGDDSAAHAEVIALRKHKNGLAEWQKILASDQAETLRAGLGEDVEQAAGIIAGTLDAAALGQSRA